jgi:predicted type IV restriction endonuclease
MYAVNEGFEWLILTNGSVWQAYHVTGGLPVEVDQALTVDLLGDEPIGRKVDLLFYLSRAALKKRQIDELWKAKRPRRPARSPGRCSPPRSPRLSSRSSGTGLATASTPPR